MKKKHRNLLFLLILIGLIFPTTKIKAQNNNWKNLIENNSLSKFKQLNGSAQFYLKNDELVGIKKKLVFDVEETIMKPVFNNINLT